MTDVYEMARMCGIDNPDGDDSPGGLWLQDLISGLDEAWTYGRFGPDSGEGADGVISEVADAAVPVYTHPRWLAFVDCCVYQSDAAAEMLQAGDNPTEAVGAILYALGEIGADAWLQSRREDEPEEEEDAG